MSVSPQPASAELTHRTTAEQHHAKATTYILGPFAMRLVLSTLLLLGHNAYAQTSSPVASALRATFERMTEQIRLAAEAMPAAAYSVRAAVGDPSFGETIAVVANYSSLYCQAVTGTRDPLAGSDETQKRDSVIRHLVAKLAYCRTALTELTDAGLADTVHFDRPKTKAALVQELVEFWAARYEYLTVLMRHQGVVPPIPCSGAGGPIDCASGVNLCASYHVPSQRGLTAVLDDAPYAVRSDQKGPYRQGVSNVAVVAAGLAGVMVLGNPSVAPADRRAVLIDLNYPVPGGRGLPLGLIRDDQNLEVAAQWGADSVTQRPQSLVDIPVGKAVSARQIDAEFHIAGVTHALQAGPQAIGHCHSDGTAVHGRGTTMGTITRVDSLTWVVELPPGSTARLFQVNHRYPYAVDKGLYRVSLRLTLRRGQ